MCLMSNELNQKVQILTFGAIETRKGFHSLSIFFNRSFLKYRTKPNK